MMTIDGAAGEGGGQILRSCLGLSMRTGTPFRIENIRANRRRPGLMRQHLTAVRAAIEIGRGKASDLEVGTTELTFWPGSEAGECAARPGDYRLAIGTAGSTTLVLQAVLPALLCLDGPTTIRLEGGTHNPMSPPFDFLAETFTPLLQRMGADVDVKLIRPGFYPAGGGIVEVRIGPATRLETLDLIDRDSEIRFRAVARVAHLAPEIGQREVKTIARKLRLDRGSLRVLAEDDSIGPGNIVSIFAKTPQLTETFTGFGERSTRAEAVASRVAGEAKRYAQRGAPVGQHLADQLLIPLALAGGGSFRTFDPTPHTITNAEIVQRFLDVGIEFHKQADESTIVEIVAN